MRRQRYVVFSWRRPEREDYGFAGLVVRFLVNVAALWFSQWIIPGFDIDGAAALLFGAVIFGTINALIKPIVSMVSCLLTVLTLGLFTLIINTLMLAITAWVAGLFDLAFEVEGFLAAFFGALVISIVSVLLSSWADRHIFRKDDAW